VGAPVEIFGGTNSAAVQFRPAAEGETILSVRVPAGLSAPAESASVTAAVKRPGLGVSRALVVGRNLQVSGVLTLGEAAPENGLAVTLTSGDPGQLLLSASPTEMGKNSIILQLRAGESSARYYLQAIGGSGTVEYAAEAPGFRSASATMTLAPSGIVITLGVNGPPDEAELFKKNVPERIFHFTADLARPVPTLLAIWTVQLHPVTHRSADITVQPVRAGMSVAIPLNNSDPAVGLVDSVITIPAGADHATTEFKPTAIGSTKISVITPKDFTESANSTAVIAIVRK
jgi:hypothetical protein